MLTGSSMTPGFNKAQASFPTSNAARSNQARTPQGERREARSWKLNEITSSSSATKNAGGVISNAIHRCLGAVLAFFKAERCPRIDPSEIWELREIAARARGGLEALF